MKRILLAFLALCMVVSLLPATAAQAATEIASGTCGENLTWTLDDEGTLTISGEGPMTDWGECEAPWFDNRSTITTVIVESGVTSIGAHAFYEIAGIRNFTLANTVTSIGRLAFGNCVNLYIVTIPAHVTQIGAGAFSGCAMKAFYVEEGNPSYSADENGSLFNKDKTELVAAHQRIFGEFTVPDGVTRIGDYAFYNIDNMTGVTFPDSVTSIGEHAFLSCDGLTSVTIGSGVTSIEDSAFYGCENLTSITLPEGLTSIGNFAFYSCTSLPTVTIPASVTSIGFAAFGNCGSLETVYFCGDAPTFGPIVFWEDDATAYYPASNSTWTSDVKQNFGGNITWVTEGTVDVNINRIFGDNRYLTSFGIANQLKETLGVEKFQTIIVAYGKNFPDALTGSYLAAVKNAPILLTEDKKQADVVAYIAENLADGGTVYILGGTSAVPASFESALSAKNITAKRLAGNDRYQTNLAILAEAGVSGDQEILICTGNGFADSLSASAAGLPILLVGKELKAEQKEFLANSSGKFVIIGGTSAVSAKLESELKSIGTVERLGGATRYETSVLVAKRFVSNPDAAILAYAQNFPDGLCGGPLAYALNAPLILTDTKHPDAADAYIENIFSGIVVGGPGLISDDAVRNIFDLTSDTPITVK